MWHVHKCFGNGSSHLIPRIHRESPEFTPTLRRNSLRSERFSHQPEGAQLGCGPGVCDTRLVPTLTALLNGPQMFILTHKLEPPSGSGGEGPTVPDPLGHPSPPWCMFLGPSMCQQKVVFCCCVTNHHKLSSLKSPGQGFRLRLAGSSA